MFGITWISERVNDRSFVSMGEDLWSLPFLIGIYCLPANPNPWVYYVCFLSIALGEIVTHVKTWSCYGLARLSVHSSNSSGLVRAELGSRGESHSERFDIQHVRPSQFHNILPNIPQRRRATVYVICPDSFPISMLTSRRSARKPSPHCNCLRQHRYTLPRY